MKDVLIIKNITREGPGLLAMLLRKHGLTSDVVDLERGDVLPTLNHKALVVLGGPDSANDSSAKMQAELNFVRRAVDEAGVPYLGICLGMQVGVKALGGAVVKSPVKEVGLIDAAGDNFVVDLTAEGQESPLFAGLPTPLPVFHLHGETVELTSDMTVLGTGKYCHTQAVELAPRAYGIQSHFELTRDMLAEWAAHDPDLKPLDAETLKSRFDAAAADYTKIGLRIFGNFLSIANLI
jgi:GMP synthase-like glutamine amidotransferase